MALSSEDIRQSAYTSFIRSNYLFVGRWDMDNPNNLLVNQIVLLFETFLESLTRFLAGLNNNYYLIVKILKIVNISENIRNKQRVK